MTWILPTSVPVLPGRLRTVGTPDKKAQKAATKRRYLASPRGRATREATRERRNAYHRAWHQKHLKRRRAYLAKKARERRARRAA